MLVPNRHESSESYRYGFQNQEKDDEVKGEGNSINYTFRMHDPRVGRFFGIDPLFKDYPHNSPYAFSENRIMDAVELEGLEAKLIITDQVTGYTVQRVAGDVWDGKNSFAVVPTYKMVLIDAQKPKIILGNYNVTRDAWYSRGEKGGFLHKLMNDDYALTNRAFEPANGKKNLYAGQGLEYPPNSGLDAYVLTQSKSSTLNAESFTTAQNTYLDGSLIDDARSNLGQSKGVMIHIAGVYEMKGDVKVAASYGCFGFVSLNQVFSTIEKAKEAINEGEVYEKSTSNVEYQKYMKKVGDVKQKTKGEKKVLITVEKRKNVEKSKTYSD
ncbi:MAG: hypothetical protein E2604_00645 [Flavobacterium sp.]|nr:hypothetical protein [Flavobacterium sp.]